MIRERQIRSKIEELRYYRKLGLKTFEEVENYLADKRRKDEAYQRKQKQNDSYVYDNQKQLQRLGQRRTRFTSHPFEQSKEGDKKHRALPNFSEEVRVGE